MDFIKNLEKNKILALIVSSFLLIIIGISVFYTISNPSMVPLYNNLSPEDSSPVLSRLQAMGVKYDINGDGNQIMVPFDRALSLRMILAQEGLPMIHSQDGYEIFDKSSNVFGSSQFMNNVNLTRAMEGEIARTISSLTPIESARVHIVLPKRDLFSKIGPSPSASVVVKIKPGYQLNKKNINGIAHLMASAVPDLLMKNITILDQTGKKLQLELNEEEKDNISKEMLEYRENIETKIQNSIESIISKYVGEDKVKATVSANINFNKEMVNIEDFNPDRQVIRSKKSNNEENTEKDSGKNVTVANNVPNYNQYLNENGDPSKKHSSYSDITNFEISRTVTNKVMQWGNINNLSVAVIVDGSYQKDENGNQVYKQRSEEEMKKLYALSAKAAGIDENRGDTLEVINLPFEQKIQSDIENTNKNIIDDKKTFAKIVLIAFAFLVLGFVGLRPWILKFIRGKMLDIKLNQIKQNTLNENDNNQYNNDKKIDLSSIPDQFSRKILTNNNKSDNMSNIDNKAANINSINTEERNGSLKNLVKHLNDSVKSDQKIAMNAILWLLNSNNSEKE
ncbi:flagellar basal-body MS-ring/collar protein FliF [Lyticum sinuosum]|uniref:Flagellar M-ring protein n=1 Tax=Lyticum sinuosum TaxID=1332059 RepID=A0AAE4VM46_9RICK|nr:flagellar basal-body MS-ring/collar protein FliF [Lyticum sinuosum]MDZ5761293.1 Flagellar M-ring protein [Lyticum sinuosum]